MSEYYPDNWVVLKITSDYKTLYKVLAGWSGGYTTGDSWRMNSGVTRVEISDNSWRFYGSSGSCYVCHKEQYRLRMNNVGIYNKLKEDNVPGYDVELMPENTDWNTIKW